MEDKVDFAFSSDVDGLWLVAVASLLDGEQINSPGFRQRQKEHDSDVRWRWVSRLFNGDSRWKLRREGAISAICSMEISTYPHVSNRGCLRFPDLDSETCICAWRYFELFRLAPKFVLHFSSSHSCVPGARYRCYAGTSCDIESTTQRYLSWRGTIHVLLRSHIV